MRALMFSASLAAFSPLDMLFYNRFEFSLFCSWLYWDDFFLFRPKFDAELSQVVRLLLTFNLELQSLRPRE